MGFHSYGWKRLFNHAQSLDTMAIENTARPVTSVRKTVMSYDCGNAPLRKKVRKKRALPPRRMASPRRRRIVRSTLLTLRTPRRRRRAIRMRSPQAHLPQTPQ